MLEALGQGLSRTKNVLFEKRRSRSVVSCLANLQEHPVVSVWSRDLAAVVANEVKVPVEAEPQHRDKRQRSLLLWWSPID